MEIGRRMIVDYELSENCKNTDVWYTLLLC